MEPFNEITRATVEAAKSGDQKALTDLYVASYEKVYRCVRMLIKDQDTAEDVMQDAYVKGFRSLNQLEKPENFNAWMKTIAINTAKNQLTKKKPILFSWTGSDDEKEIFIQEPADETLEHKPEKFAERQEITRMLNEILLDSLSDAQRLVTVLHFYENMTAKEIADELGLNENTVYSRLKASKKIIKAKVEEREKKNNISFLGEFQQVMPVVPDFDLLARIKEELAHPEKQGKSSVFGRVRRSFKKIFKKLSKK